MSKKADIQKITVLSREVSVEMRGGRDFICLTDIARYRDQGTDDLIRNWLRNRNTIEFLGLWEHLHNPDFKPVEFDGFRKQAGLNSFTITPKQWIEKTGAIGIESRAGRYGGTLNPGAAGNIRDQATAGQLVCLSNLENLNALFIREKMPQHQRLAKLNAIAIEQMKLLTDDMRVKRLEPPEK